MKDQTSYLDHNATTPVRPEVLEAMLPFLREDFGNPNSAYRLGQRARKAVEDARARVAALLGAADEEIVFTSCGSEADCLAIAGGAWAAFDESQGRRAKIVSSQIEHDAVRGIVGSLRRRGFEAASAAPQADGVLQTAAVDALVDERTALVSIMHANNEVGTLQPIAEIARAARAKGALVHTDAVQSAGKVPLSVRELGVDLLALSGHKINAPKGIGALFVRKGVRLSQMITGHQEKNRRGGTEAVASIVGLGVACELARRELGHAQELLRLRRRLEEGVLGISGSRLNGHPEKRLPSCAHFSIEGVDGHQLVVALDLEGIAISAGPACSTGASAPSHVLTAMGVPAERATGSIRVSMGWGTHEEELDRLLAVLPRAVEKLRAVGARL